MKTRYIAIPMIAGALMLTGCNDWLKEEAPGSQDFDDFFTSGAVAIQTVNACYVPLAWEYNNSYFSEWFFGDIASDDALKGGQDVADGADAYDIDNFKVNANNAIVLDYYRAKYQGIARCNLALQQVSAMEPDEYMTQERKDCLMGEAYFMRAFYYFQLVRVYGGVPLVDFVIDSSDKWQQPRATAQEVYDHIVADLLKAEEMLWNKSQYPAEDLGRATKGAAQAMLCKAYLYNKDYDNAYVWGKKFREEQYGKEYTLCSNYSDNFTLAGENGPGRAVPPTPDPSPLLRVKFTQRLGLEPSDARPVCRIRAGRPPSRGYRRRTFRDCAAGGGGELSRLAILQQQDRIQRERRFPFAVARFPLADELSSGTRFRRASALCRGRIGERQGPGRRQVGA